MMMMPSAVLSSGVSGLWHSSKAGTVEFEILGSVSSPLLHPALLYTTSSQFMSGNWGNGLCGSAWYQNAVEAISSCSGK
jgi:hypothetical protein